MHWDPQSLARLFLDHTDQPVLDVAAHHAQDIALVLAREESVGHDPPEMLLAMLLVVLNRAHWPEAIAFATLEPGNVLGGIVSAVSP